MALLLLLALVGTAHAADEAQVLRLKGEQLAAQDRCAEALPALREARRLDPDDAGAALLEGQCAIREGSYADAVTALEQARQLDPGLAEAAGFLGVAHYHLGDIDRAAEELKEAERGLPPDSPALAQVYLYRGLVLLERADAAQAAADLERASSLAPELVDPAATYFAGRAWQAAADRERADQALRRVIEQAPGTVWAREAELALETRVRRPGTVAGIDLGVGQDRGR